MKSNMNRIFDHEFAEWLRKSEKTVPKMVLEMVAALFNDGCDMDEDSLDEWLEGNEFTSLAVLGDDKDMYVKYMEKLWNEFEDKMLYGCPLCGKVSLKNRKLQIEEEGHSDTVCPYCRS